MTKIALVTGGTRGIGASISSNLKDPDIRLLQIMLIMTNQG